MSNEPHGHEGCGGGGPRQLVGVKVMRISWKYWVRKICSWWEISRDSEEVPPAVPVALGRQHGPAQQGSGWVGWWSAGWAAASAGAPASEQGLRPSVLPPLTPSVVSTEDRHVGKTIQCKVVEGN